MDANSPFIVCDHLVKIYKVAGLEVVALQGLDMVVSKAEIVGVVGASGSGKSTLMNVLGGLDRPSAGHIWVDGDDLLKMSNVMLDKYRRKKVGFMWQHGARNLVSYLNAVENVELPMVLSGKVWRKRRRAEELLEMVGLAARRYHQLSELSGGEQQRVAISVALANDPVLLLADEPTGEVDTPTALTIYKIFRDLNRELGLTIVIVSHDPELSRHVDRVVAIRDGRLATETVRQGLGRNGSGESTSHEEMRFEELIVLDSVGRLQVPKEFLVRYQIGSRVRLEPAEGGILIRAVDIPEKSLAPEILVKQLTQSQKHGWLHGLANRLIKRNTE